MPAPKSAPDRAASRFQLLDALRRSGPMAQVELAAATGLGTTTVSALVTTLLAEKLLRPCDDPQAPASRWQLLDALRRGGPMAQVELAAATGLATTTVSALVTTLLAEKLLRPCDDPQAPASRGRPRRRLALEPLAAEVAALHLAPEGLRLVLVDFAGQSLAEERLPLPLARLGQKPLERILRDAIARAQLASGRAPRRPAAIALVQPAGAAPLPLQLAPAPLLLSEPEALAHAAPHPGLQLVMMLDDTFGQALLAAGTPLPIAPDHAGLRCGPARLDSAAPLAALAQACPEAGARLRAATAQGTLAAALGQILAQGHPALEAATLALARARGEAAGALLALCQPQALLLAGDGLALGPRFTAALLETIAALQPARPSRLQLAPADPFAPARGAARRALARLGAPA